MPDLPPVRILTTSPIASLSGLQSLQSVSLVAGERVAVNGQADQVTNGIYEVQTTDWTRASDFASGASVAPGTDLYVTSGTYAAEEWRLIAPSNRTVGTDAITFQKKMRATVLGEGRGTDIGSDNAINVEDSGISGDGSDVVVSGITGGTIDRTGRWKAVSTGAGASDLQKPNVDLVSLTNLSLTARPAIDGQATADNYRVAALGQTDNTTNGVYTLPPGGGAWSRVTDLDAAAEFQPGTWFRVSRGNTLKGRVYFFANETQPPNITTTALLFEEDSEAGDGLEKSGNTLALPDSGIVSGTTHVGPLSITHDSHGIASDIEGGYGQEVYIEGLVYYYSGDDIDIWEGAAHIPSTGVVVENAVAYNRDLGVLTANTFYYVYVSGSAGVNALFEGSTTAPAAPYRGTARTKTGDTSRRYVGAYRSNSSGTSFYNFTVEGSGNNPLVLYDESTTAAPFRVLTGGTATTQTSVSCAAVVPPTSRMARLRVKANQTSATPARIRFSGSASNFLSLSTGESFIVDMPLSATQTFDYLYNTAPTGGGSMWKS